MAAGGRCRGSVELDTDDDIVSHLRVSGDPHPVAGSQRVGCGPAGGGRGERNGIGRGLSLGAVIRCHTQSNDKRREHRD